MCIGQAPIVWSSTWHNWHVLGLPWAPGLNPNLLPTSWPKKWISVTLNACNCFFLDVSPSCHHPCLRSTTKMEVSPIFPRTLSMSIVVATNSLHIGINLDNTKLMNYMFKSYQESTSLFHGWFNSSLVYKFLHPIVIMLNPLFGHLMLGGLVLHGFICLVYFYNYAFRSHHLSINNLFWVCSQQYKRARASVTLIFILYVSN